MRRGEQVVFLDWKAGEQPPLHMEANTYFLAHLRYVADLQENQLPKIKQDEEMQLISQHRHQK